MHFHHKPPLYNKTGVFRKMLGTTAYSRKYFGGLFFAENCVGGLHFSENVWEDFIFHFVCSWLAQQFLLLKKPLWVANGATSESTW